MRRLVTHRRSSLSYRWSSQLHVVVEGGAVELLLPPFLSRVACTTVYYGSLSSSTPLVLLPHGVSDGLCCIHAATASAAAVEG